MTRYSVQSREQLKKGYGFLSFPKNMVKNIGKNISKILNSKYSQKLLHHEPLKLLQKASFKKQQKQPEI